MPKNKNPGKAAPISASQNFLTSSFTIRRLLGFSDLKSGDLVYEIGPGQQPVIRAVALPFPMLAAVLWKGGTWSD